MREPLLGVGRIPRDEDRTERRHQRDRLADARRAPNAGPKSKTSTTRASPASRTQTAVHRRDARASASASATTTCSTGFGARAASPSAMQLGPSVAQVGATDDEAVLRERLQDHVADRRGTSTTRASSDTENEAVGWRAR